MVTTPEGMWTIVSVEMGGKVINQGSTLGSEEWTFSGSCLTVARAGAQTGRFRYTLDQAKSPAEIDLKKLDSPGTPPAGWVGIYRIDGDVLTICAFPNVVDNMPRPSDFKTERDDLQVLWKMKRVTVAQPREDHE